MIFRPGPFWGEGETRASSETRSPIFPSGDGEGPLARWLHCVDQKIPGERMKIAFLGAAEPARRPGVTRRFGVLGFSTGDSAAACGFLSHTGSSSGCRQGF